MERKIVFAAVLAAAFLAACSSVSADGGGRSLSVMCWNAETFFDAVRDGTEYEEFRGGGWDRGRYEERLDRLASVVKRLDCDVVVVEEMEKAGQLRDVANRLGWSFLGKPYRWTGFASEPDGAIGVAVMSRLPILSVTAHSVDAAPPAGCVRPSMRPIMRVVVDVGGREISILVNHWKSKAGGAEASEFWRDAQERLLSRLVLRDVEAGLPVAACGDFNRSIEEFRREVRGSANVSLKGGAAVFSPWYAADGSLPDPGSYWFRGGWERIDHFFLAGGAVAESFRAECDGEWADAEGRPRRYSVRSGRGYSDHLPLTCTISF